MRHVLIVDDDADIRNLLRLSLEWDGYSVETASDGVSALDILLRADEPWLVLLDINMPRMSGLEVCERLAAISGLASRHVVVLMTAGILPDGDTPSPVRALLSKPFDLDTLTDVLAEVADAASEPGDELDSSMPPSSSERHFTGLPGRAA